MTITIDEAIKQLALLEDEMTRIGREPKINALRLGIEALKRCKEARKKAYFTTRSLLPGETRE